MEGKDWTENEDTEVEDNYVLIGNYDGNVEIEQGNKDKISPSLEEGILAEGIDYLKFHTDISRLELESGDAILLKNGKPIIPQFKVKVLI